MASSSPPPVLQQQQQPLDAVEAEDAFSRIFSALKVVTNEVRVLQRDKVKTDRIIGKRKASTAPNNFLTPVKISPGLCDFLGLPAGEMVSRTNVTRGINAYIKEHNLQADWNKRVILPDDKLKAILTLGEGDELTYFTMQKFNKHNFV